MKFSEKVMESIKKASRYCTKIFTQKRILNILAILSLSVLLTVAVYAAMPLRGESDLYKNVIRLHVLANSDSEEDQQLKLSVRDEIVKVTDELFSDCDSLEKADKIVMENEELLRNRAKAVISDKGYNYDVNIDFGKETYPERQYENFTFPAGEYTSLRIKIGSAKGRNWWCVLFPPLCVKTASKDISVTEKLAGAGFDNDTISVITENNPRIKVRFKFLEMAQALFSK